MAEEAVEDDEVAAVPEPVHSEAVPELVRVTYEALLRELSGMLLRDLEDTIVLAQGRRVQLQELAQQRVQRYDAPAVLAALRPEHVHGVVLEIDVALL